MLTTKLSDSCLNTKAQIHENLMVMKLKFRKIEWQLY